MPPPPPCLPPLSCSPAGPVSGGVTTAARSLALFVIAWIVASAASLAFAKDAPAAGSPWRIVILHSADSRVPGMARSEAGFHDEVAARDATAVEIFAESLDVLRFPSSQIDAELVALLRKKYAAKPPHIVVASASMALDFAERHHAELWPGAALIFMNVQESAIRGTRLRHAASGATAHLDAAGSLELALRLLPQTKRAVLIGGASAYDHILMEEARTQMPGFAGRVEVAYLMDAPFKEILERVSKLAPGTIIVPISMFRDSEGRTFVPLEFGTKLAQMSPVPTLAMYEPWIGLGMLGGHVIRFGDQGREAGRLALEIIAGRDVRTLPVRSPPSACTVDWRELRRWSIPIGRVPAECQVVMREYSFLEQNWGKVVAAAAVMLLQALLIVLLILQHRGRRKAELESLARNAQLAHAARLATVGEFTASIAHEINQPLGAILANADAAEILLESPDPDIGEVRHILADIRRDDERASNVIVRLRALLARRELERVRLDPNDVVLEAIALISREAERRSVRLVEKLGSGLPAVLGDRLHLVQVLIILVVNAFDAMDFTASSKRIVLINTSARGRIVELSVSDSGHGISVADVPRLFDSFFTTKKDGMGLGLSIARSIVEAHGGEIHAQDRAGGGATFLVELPAAA